MGTFSVIYFAFIHNSCKYNIKVEILYYLYKKIRYPGRANFYLRSERNLWIGTLYSYKNPLDSRK